MRNKARVIKLESVKRIKPLTGIGRRVIKRFIPMTSEEHQTYQAKSKERHRLFNISRKEVLNDTGEDTPFKSESYQEYLKSVAHFKRVVFITKRETFDIYRTALMNNRDNTLTEDEAMDIARRKILGMQIEKDMKWVTVKE